MLPNLVERLFFLSGGKDEAMERATVTLTPEESKRLIAKAVARMDIVQEAKTNGYIGFAVCSSAGYVIEELLHVKLNLSKYCCGFIHENGACFVHPDQETRQLVLVKGEQYWLNWPAEDITKFINDMDHDDVIIKSGNVLDIDGRAGTLAAVPSGGEMGKYLPYIYTLGINLIVPTTLNKTAPVKLDKIIRSIGINKIKTSRSYGLTYGMLPLPGIVITEIEALKILTGAEAIPIAMGGLGSGDGAVTLLIEGDSKSVQEAWDIVKNIKGEPKLENLFGDCKICGEIRKALDMKCSTRRK